jgi:hypothetical protein
MSLDFLDVNTYQYFNPQWQKIEEENEFFFHQLVNLTLSDMALILPIHGNSWRHQRHV